MPDNTTQRPTRAEINLDHLAFNFRSVRRFVGENIMFMAVVKADAYGHCAPVCAKKLEGEGIDWFGVALPEEGLELRQAGISKPVLCLGSFWNGQENLLLKHDLTPVVYQIEQAESYQRAAVERGIIAAVHVKIDTGMGRIGVRFDEVSEFAEKLKSLRNLRVEGIMTHFAAADNLQENDFTTLQIERFDESVAIFEALGFRPIYKDLANSPGAIAHPRSRGNLVRLGGVLYGLGDDVLPSEIDLPKLKPVMSIHSQIAHLKRVPAGETIGYSRTFATRKDSLIATVPIGYQDGLPRILSNRGRVIVGGKFAPMIGRISMDWTMIDVSAVPNVKIGDDVIIIGESGDLKIPASETAGLSETISYEITCGINRRVPRVYAESR